MTGDSKALSLDEILEDFRTTVWSDGWNGNSLEKAKQSITEYVDSEVVKELEGVSQTYPDPVLQEYIEHRIKQRKRLEM